MWLSYEKPGEEGYILKNNKNKVDRIERTPVIISVEERGQDSRTGEGRKQIPGPCQSSQWTCWFYRGEMRYYGSGLFILVLCGNRFGREHETWEMVWRLDERVSVCVCLLTDIGYCYN